MRARHRHHKMHGGACEQRARGGAVHHPDNRVKFISGDGIAAKMHAGKRKRGGGIHIKKSHQGLLHKNLGVAKGQKIPAKKLSKALHSSNPAVKKRAVFAENAKHWHH